MSAATTERLVKAILRLLAVSFLGVGLLFLLFPGTVSQGIADFGDVVGEFADPPETGLRLWLTLSFAYMSTIGAICVVAQADPVRYRALMLVLALAKATSSLAGLGFFVLQQNVFAYLLNFVVDGALVALALALWVAIGRVESTRGPG